MDAVACPFCGSSEWKELPKPIILREDNPAVRGGGFSSRGLVCGGCGFIRLQLPVADDRVE